MAMTNSERLSENARLDFLDNFRIALTTLVIYMHTCIAYGGEGIWPYRSPYHARSSPLTAMNGLAQSFYMGSFFFLSGLFSRRALVRKTSWCFMKDKLIRVAVPTLIYTLLAGPLQTATLQLILEHQIPSVYAIANYFKDLSGVQGPVWYSALLLVFDSAYALSRAPRLHEPKMKTIVEEDLTLRVILAGVVGCSACSFVIRLCFPTTYIFTPLHLRIGYLPQYVTAYFLGTHIDHPESVKLLPPGAAGILVSLTVALVALWTGYFGFSLTDQTIANTSGGFNPHAAFYAVLNEVLGYLIFAGLFEWFRRHANVPCGTVGQYTYSAFLLHAPVSVTVEAAVDPWKANAIIKTLIVGTLNVAASFVAAWCIMRIKVMRRAL